MLSQRTKFRQHLMLALSALFLSQSGMALAKKSPDAEGEPDQKTSQMTSRKTGQKAEKKQKKNSDQNNNQNNNARSNRFDEAASKGPGAVGNAALDRETLTLINSGDWKGLADKLGQQLATDKGVDNEASRLRDSYRRGWQAFALMYLSRYDELATISGAMPIGSAALDSARDDNEKRMVGNALVVKAFGQIGKNDLNGAETTLKSAAPISQGDCLYNFALAAVSGKKNDIAASVKYTQLATDLEPRFAWGYRTVGFLAQKRLKDNALAEDAYTKALAVEPRLSEARDALVELKLARNDFDGAIDVAEDAIRLDEHIADNHFRLAQILTQQWRLRESLKALDMAIADDATSAKYFRNRASIKRYQRDFSGAIADQGRAVELSKDKSFELTELGNLYVFAGDKGKAIDNYKAALVQNAASDVAREKLFKLLVEEKRYGDLLALYQEQLVRYPNNSDLHLGYAAVLLGNGDKDKAIAEFGKAAELNLTNPSAHRALGAYYFEQKEFALAAKEYTAALNILPTSVKDMVALGFCYAETDDYMQAEAAFTTAIALQKLNTTAQPDDPSQIDVMRSLAYLLYDEGRFGDAAGQFENIIAIFRGRGATLEDTFFLARCKLMRDLGEGPARLVVDIYRQLPEARQKAFRYGMIESLIDADQEVIARQILDEVPESEHGTMAYCLYEAAIDRLSGDGKKALAAIEPAIASAQTAKGDERAMGARILCEKARSLMNVGDLDLAIVNTKAALALYEKCYPANLLMAELLLKKGDAAGSLKASQHALQLDPYYAQAYVLSGEAQLAAGKSAEGLDLLKKAVELYPNWIDAHKALQKAYKKQNMAAAAAHEDAEIARLTPKPLLKPVTK